MTPEEVHDLRELRLELLALRVEIREQLQKIRLLIWLPVIASLTQILSALASHYHWI